MDTTSTPAAQAAPRRPTRSRLLGTAAALGVSLVVLHGGAAAADEAPQIMDFQLPNGLEVVVIPNHRAPVVTHQIWYRVGSADETPGKSGLAHFLEHLMFKGTGKHPAGVFTKWLDAVGAAHNADTSFDYTRYWEQVGKERLPEVMAFEADRMTGLLLGADEVLPERDVVLEEYNMRMGNSPGARLGAQMSAALFLNHPYGRPVIGWPHEIARLSREDAFAFYRRFYTPNNAIVVVAGDVTPDEVRTLAEHTYGQVPRVAEAPPRVRPQEPEPAALREVTLADDRIVQPSFARSYLVPVAVTTKDGDPEALAVLANVLNGETGRLYRALVIEQHVAVSASAGYDDGTMDYGTFDVAAVPASGISFETVEAAIDAVIADVADHGIEEAELERAKAGIMASRLYARDSQTSMANWYGFNVMLGTSAGEVDRTAKIEAVTAEAVRKVARTWLDKRRAVNGRLVKELPQHPDGRASNPSPSNL